MKMKQKIFRPTEEQKQLLKLQAIIAIIEILVLIICFTYYYRPYHERYNQVIGNPDITSKNVISGIVLIDDDKEIGLVDWNITKSFENETNLLTSSFVTTSNSSENDVNGVVAISSSSATSDLDTTKVISDDDEKKNESTGSDADTTKPANYDSDGDDIEEDIGELIPVVTSSITKKTDDTTVKTVSETTTTTTVETTTTTIYYFYVDTTIPYTSAINTSGTTDATSDTTAGTSNTVPSTSDTAASTSASTSDTAPGTSDTASGTSDTAPGTSDTPSTCETTVPIEDFDGFEIETGATSGGSDTNVGIPSGGLEVPGVPED